MIKETFDHYLRLHTIITIKKQNDNCLIISKECKTIIEQCNWIKEIFKLNKYKPNTVEIIFKSFDAKNMFIQLTKDKNVLEIVKSAGYVTIELS